MLTPLKETLKEPEFNLTYWLALACLVLAVCLYPVIK